MTGRRRRPRLATALAVLCVLALAGGLAAGLWMRSRSADIEADDTARAEVVQAAARFTSTWNTIDPKHPQAYVDAVTPLLSTKFRKEFTDTKDDVIGGITQLGLSSRGKVLNDDDGIPLVGIADLDADSAKVLVVSDSQRVSGGQPVVRHWRWELTMVNVDGSWLVDDLKAV
ncbi:hypothetical protein [Nocardioides marmoribigeumensis]|uniref:Mce-associated membrane protein n=1 Tax=Nocardioides marmoribigeumensis TaxID=433649 RepID=A0ABU2BWY8_9ACTN|nr:hypothetical protein [Nocardioides marmoribigeumensis]MDR7362923.1 hypothetical protein [Nocardioides marmoribigeumensis]